MSRIGVVPPRGLYLLCCFSSGWCTWVQCRTCGWRWYLRSRREKQSTGLVTPAGRVQTKEDQPLVDFADCKTERWKQQFAVSAGHRRICVVVCSLKNVEQNDGRMPLIKLSVRPPCILISNYGINWRNQDFYRTKFPKPDTTQLKLPLTFPKIYLQTFDNFYNYIMLGIMFFDN